MSVDWEQIPQDALSLNRIILQIAIVFWYEGGNSVSFKEGCNDLTQPENR
jgi:hypothetical protein